MNEPVMAELIISQGAIVAPSNGNSANSTPAPSLQDQVHNAAEFGWLVAELLGRSYLLLEQVSEEQDMDKLTAQSLWNGEKLVMLQGLLTPREKMRSLTAHMCYLAELLGIGSMCKIDHPYIDGGTLPDPYNEKPYADTVQETVKKLCQGKFDEGENFETVRGSINERLFFWDLKINDILQEKPAVIYRAYQVGYCLGALRWWYGLPGFKLDSSLKAKVLQYLPVLGPHLPQFAASGLVCSVGPWWDALEAQPLAVASASPSGSQQASILTPTDLQKQVNNLQEQISNLQPDAAPSPDAQKKISDLQTQKDALQRQLDALQADGLAPADLQKQGHIWYSLIAGECDALSYLDPTVRNRPYIWQVFQVTWPFFVGGAILVLLIIALAIYLIVAYHNQIVSAIVTAGGFLAIWGIIQNVQKSTGDILQKAVSDVTATIKGSYLDGVWNATLQKEVNKAVFVPPPVNNAPQSPAKK